MKTKALEYTPYEEGLSQTWMGGEPPEAATVVFAGRDDYPDNVVAWMNMDQRPEVQNAYAKLFAAAPDLLAACKMVLEKQKCDVLHGRKTENGVILHADAYESLVAAIRKAERG